MRAIFMRKGGDGSGGAKFRAEAAEDIAQRRVAGVQRMRGQTEGSRRTRGAARHLAAGDARVGRHAQPGTEVFAGLEAGELWSEFRHDSGSNADIDAGDSGQVGPTNSIQVGADIERGLVGALPRGLVLPAIGHGSGGR
jgi:hypothetical protein